MIKTYITDIRQFDDEAVFREALEIISPYRRQKIALLKHEKDKKRSLGASITLDMALKQYGLQERTMEYDLGKQGKPYFRYYPDLYFSVSHSGEYAICSIGPQEIGNDIERVRAGKERVGERFFAEEEIVWMKEASLPAEREDRMFRVWTMKESFLKVTGVGMSLPLKEFAIMIENDGNIRLRQNVTDKTYHIKEYAMPTDGKEDSRYKISVCSEDVAFASDLKWVRWHEQSAFFR